MELYTAMLQSRYAGEALLRAHALRSVDKFSSEYYREEAMRHINEMAATLGLEITERKQVAA